MPTPWGEAFKDYVPDLNRKVDWRDLGRVVSVDLTTGELKEVTRPERRKDVQDNQEVERLEAEGQDPEVKRQLEAAAAFELEAAQDWASYLTDTRLCASLMQKATEDGRAIVVRIAAGSGWPESDTRSHFVNVERLLIAFRRDDATAAEVTTALRNRPDTPRLPNAAFALLLDKPSTRVVILEAFRLGRDADRANQQWLAGRAEHFRREVQRVEARAEELHRDKTKVEERLMQVRAMVSREWASEVARLRAAIQEARDLVGSPDGFRAGDVQHVLDLALEGAAPARGEANEEDGHKAPDLVVEFRKDGRAIVRQTVPREAFDFDVAAGTIEIDGSWIAANRPRGTTETAVSFGYTWHQLEDDDLNRTCKTRPIVPKDCGIHPVGTPAEWSTLADTLARLEAVVEELKQSAPRLSASDRVRLQAWWEALEEIILRARRAEGWRFLAGCDLKTLAGHADSLAAFAIGQAPHGSDPKAIAKTRAFAADVAFLVRFVEQLEKGAFGQ